MSKQEAAAPVVWEKVRGVDVDSLIFDSELQMRAEPCSTTQFLEDLKTAGGAYIFPPIKVVQVRSRLYVVDGFTRGGAVKRFNESDPKKRCNVVIEKRQGTRMDALKEALGANANHGFRRTNADKRLAVVRALAAMEGSSAEAIAAVCRVSHTYVYNIRQELSEPETPPTAEGTSKAARAHEANAKADREHKQQKEQEKKAATELQKSLGKCPVCKKQNWQEDGAGYICGGCGHHHGEPAALSGDEEQELPAAKPEQPKTQRGQSARPTAGMVNLTREKWMDASTQVGKLIRLLDELGAYDRVKKELTAITELISKEKAKHK